MPTYVYTCDCGEKTEGLFAYPPPDKIKCPFCRKPAQKEITAPVAVYLKIRPGHDSRPKGGRNRYDEA